MHSAIFEKVKPTTSLNT